MRSRPKPKGYDLEMAGAWFQAVCHRRAMCVGCGRRGRLQAHHAVDKSWLEKVARTAKLDERQRNALLWDFRNGLPVCTACHEAHTNRSRRLGRAVLSGAQWEFAEAVDALLGTQAGTRRLEREYP